MSVPAYCSVPMACSSDVGGWRGSWDHASSENGEGIQLVPLCVCFALRSPPPPHLSVVLCCLNRATASIQRVSALLVLGFYRMVYRALPESFRFLTKARILCAVCLPSMAR